MTAFDTTHTCHLQQANVSCDTTWPCGDFAVKVCSDVLVETCRVVRFERVMILNACHGGATPKMLTLISSYLKSRYGESLKWRCEAEGAADRRFD